MRPYPPHVEFPIDSEVNEALMAIPGIISVEDNPGEKETLLIKECDPDGQIVIEALTKDGVWFSIGTVELNLLKNGLFRPPYLLRIVQTEL